MPIRYNCKKPVLYRPHCTRQSWSHVVHRFNRTKLPTESAKYVNKFRKKINRPSSELNMMKLLPIVDDLILWIIFVRWWPRIGVVEWSWAPPRVRQGSKKSFGLIQKKNSSISDRIYSWKREKILKTLFRTHVLGRLAWAVQLETGKTQRPLTYWIRRPTHRFGRLGISGMLAPLHSRPTRRSRGGGSGLVPRYMPIRSRILPLKHVFSPLVEKK